MAKFLEENKELIIVQRLCKVGVAQFSSVAYNLEASLQKLEKVVKDASAQGVQVLLFPEAFLTGYPHGCDLGVVFGQRLLAGRKVYEMMHSSAVRVPQSSEMEWIRRVARENKVFLVVGVIEKEDTSTSLYCSVVFVGEDGEYLGKHRKLMPTANERLCWSPGDGSTLGVWDSPAGKIGAVICWENYMPLLRATMYSKGIQIWCAPMADSSDNWQHVMRTVALEGRCFVLACNQFSRRSDFPPDTDYPNLVKDVEGDRILCRGGSMIVGPLGNVLKGPNFEGEELMVAEIDTGEVIRARFDLDVVGHYSRPDIFTLYVNEKSNPGVVGGSDAEVTAKLEINKSKQSDV